MPIKVLMFIGTLNNLEIMEESDEAPGPSGKASDSDSSPSLAC